MGARVQTQTSIKERFCRDAISVSTSFQDKTHAKLQVYCEKTTTGGREKGVYGVFLFYRVHVTVFVMMGVVLPEAQAWLQK